LGPRRFIDGEPVLKPARRSRLALCRLSADTLKLGQGLLGIPSLERMGGGEAGPGLATDLGLQRPRPRLPMAVAPPPFDP